MPVDRIRAALFEVFKSSFVHQFFVDCKYLSVTDQKLEELRLQSNDVFTSEYNELIIGICGAFANVILKDNGHIQTSRLVWHISCEYNNDQEEINEASDKSRVSELSAPCTYLSLVNSVHRCYGSGYPIDYPHKYHIDFQASQEKFSPEGVGRHAHWCPSLTRKRFTF